MVEKKQFQRLPKAVQPVNYKLSLKPDLKKFTFSGEECIDVQIKSKTRKITVNCLDIQISTVSFQHADTVLSSEDIVYNAKDEIVTFNFKEELPLGDAKLNISFVGELNDKMKGFYRSKYLSSDGEEKYCAVTQFEPTDARRAFPCWDEPACKATFDITITAPKDQVVLSNMDVSSEDVNGDEKTVSFNRTPIMSTYLVAYIVGEFDFVEGKTEEGTTVRVYTPLGKTNQGEFALQISLKTLPFYNKYFGIAYPLPKMDLIAIPDFAAGAMENWGLVTYRETALLVDPKETSASAKQWVALVVGHELAHQWFGNLTTMEWWTDLWLNEGFASWIEYLCVDYCCPEYHIWQQFVATEYTQAQNLDALQNSHPIEVEVGHPSEIDEIFDAISYSKGASVIRMLHTYVGEKYFKAGLNTYLNTFKYKNGETDDLWEHLEKASGKPIKQVMSTWTKQMGYPVLTVTDEQSQSQRIIKLKQKKFTADGSPDADNQQWAVPVTITTSQKHTMSSLMNDPEMVIFVDHMDEKDWVKVNPGLTGFYRVCYSYSMISLLIPAISTLSAVDRLGLENDTFALSVAGVSPTTSFLELLSGYKQEADFVVWKDLCGNLSQLSVVLQNTNSYDSFKRFLLSLCKPIASRLGWDPVEEEDHLTNMLRCLILNVLGGAGDEEVIKESKRRFASHVDGTQLINADIRSAVYSTVMRSGDDMTLEQMTTLYLNTTHMEEKMRILRSLGSTPDPDLITKVLQFAMSDQVRSQDTVFGISSCTGSLTGRKLAWEFVKQNWDELMKRYDGGFLLSRLVKSTCSNFATEAEYTDIEKFFKDHPTPSAERVIQQSLESVKLNCKWLQRDKQSIEKWLSTTSS